MTLCCGAMLQKRNAGINPSLSRAMTRTKTLPNLLAFGRLIKPAKVLPTKSPALKAKKQPTGIKYTSFHSFLPELVLLANTVKAGNTHKVAIKLIKIANAQIHICLVTLERLDLLV